MVAFVVLIKIFCPPINVFFLFSLAMHNVALCRLSWAVKPTAALHSFWSSGRKGARQSASSHLVKPSASYVTLNWLTGAWVQVVFSEFTSTLTLAPLPHREH